MAYKDTLKSKTNRVAEVGRSMTEMLGVLAVIGVLSIAALTGYRMAMNSYHANELLNNVRLMAANVIQREEIIPDATGLINTAEFNPTVSYPMKAEIWNDTADLFVVVADDVQKGVCKSALDKVNDSYTVYVFNETHADGVRFNKDNNICDDVNQMQFLFNNTGLCEPTCPNCCYGKCCASDQACYEDTHECGPNVNGCKVTENSCGTGCCTKGNSCCGGTTCCVGLSECCGNQCGCGQDTNGVDLTCDYNTNSCACPSPLTMVDGVCQCPENQIYINGTCVSPDCRKNEGSSTYDCYFREERCGSGCNETGLNCKYGMCTNLCPTNTTYTFNSGNRYYGCLSTHTFGTEEKELNCTKVVDSISCFEQRTDKSCGSSCSLNGTGCYYGVCGNEYCGIGYAKLTPAPYLEARYATCFYDKYNCKINAQTGEETCDSFYCASRSCTGDPNKKACAIGCTNNNYENCASAYNDCTGCSIGELNETGDACCQTDDKGLKRCCQITPGNGRHCTVDEKICGYDCNNAKETVLGQACSTGTCVSSDCPAGTEWSFLKNYSYGCYNPTENVACVKTGKVYYCYKDMSTAVLLANGTNSYASGTLCGTNCTDYLGTNCQECFSDENICADGWTLNSLGVSNSRCSLGDTYCRLYANYNDCFKGSMSCGYCKSTDATDCYAATTLTGAKTYCSQADCPAGTTLLYDSSKTNYPYYCGMLPNAACENGTCTIGTSQCGTGCQNDGSSCTTGVCEQSECGDLSLVQATNQYYGCYNQALATSCYKLGNAYVCYKNGVQCGTGCDIDGTNCTSANATCEPEE